MSEREKKLQEDVIRQIKDTRFSIKGYFQDLFKQLLPNELLQNERMTVVNQLINQDTLPATLAQKYEKDGYVLLFYAHKTHSDMISPFNHDTHAAHTSLLLCKVTNKKITQVLNIDGYHNLNYMDIIGERPGARPHPLIRNRLVIDAPDEDNPHKKKPLQSPSWENLNCPLYAFAFAKAILDVFNIAPYSLDNLFNGSKPQEALDQLKDMIIQGIEGIYVKQKTGTFYRDVHAGMRYHARVRETLAQTVATQYLKQQAAAEQPAVVSALPLSLFKPPVADLSKATRTLVELCTTYQTHLYEEMQKVTRSKDLQQILQTHQINKEKPTELDHIIKKYTIVNKMLNALNDKAENDLNRIQNMKAILTPETRATLAEHRSTSGKFLHAILNILSALFRQKWSYKSAGEELNDNLGNFPIIDVRSQV